MICIDFDLSRGSCRECHLQCHRASGILAHGDRLISSCLKCLDLSFACDRSRAALAGEIVDIYVRTLFRTVHGYGEHAFGVGLHDIVCQTVVADAPGNVHVLRLFPVYEERREDRVFAAHGLYPEICLEESIRLRIVIRSVTEDIL